MIALLFLAAIHIDVKPADALIDEPVTISVTGATPGARVTIALGDASKDTFAADANGTVEDADPMRLFWTASHNADSWKISASDGTTSAETTITRRAVASDVTMTSVHEHGMVGEFYQPPGAGRHPAMLVLSGSGGGIPPASSFAGGLASRGYAVLALAYFGVEGLPSRLHDIPLEYFGTALDWLMAQPTVDPKRIGILGVSRGGELALLLASILPQFRAVVAYVPSNVVVGGCCTGRSESSWTIGGRALLWAFPERDNDLRQARAEIHVENIHGAVLLISGRSDHVWPSSEMSNAIMARLDHNHFAYPHEHLTYDNAGHGLGRPYTSTMDINEVRHPLTGRVIALGGTPEGTAKAREDAWRHTLKFLEENLR